MYLLGLYVLTCFKLSDLRITSKACDLFKVFRKVLIIFLAIKRK